MAEKAAATDVLAGMDLIDPCWELPGDKHRLAPRINALSGKRAGFLDNRKDNADVILKRLASRLEADYGTVTSLYRTKAVYSRRAEPSMLDELVHHCDFVITATGA